MEVIKNMLEELEILIKFIEKQYKHMHVEWKKSNLYVPIHQKNKLVKDIKNDNDILNTILNYRLFLNEIELFLLIYNVCKLTLLISIKFPIFFLYTLTKSL